MGAFEHRHQVSGQPRGVRVRGIARHLRQHVIAAKDGAAARARARVECQGDHRYYAIITGEARLGETDEGSASPGSV